VVYWGISNFVPGLSRLWRLQRVLTRQPFLRSNLFAAYCFFNFYLVQINRYLFFSSVLAPMSSIGAAIAIDEYVPTMMPKPMAKVNPLNAWPPKMYIIRTTMKVVNDVNSVLERVWLILFEIILGLSVASLPRFSLIRSKTTMVSLSEYPIIVRNAAISWRLILKSCMPRAFPRGVPAI